MSWFSRLKNALHTRPLEESLDAEIQDHIERRAAALREAGHTPDEARRAALAAFGNVSRVRDQSREIRLSSALESAMQDVRYAWRTLRRRPAFTISAGLSLSLAIGANTAIYAIVDAAMLRPLPVPEPTRVFTLAAPTLDAGVTSSSETESFSYPLYLQLRAAAGDSARLAVFGPTDRAEVQGRDSAAPVQTVRQQFVSGEAFAMLRVPPAVGRLFSRDDDRDAGIPRTAVLSFDFWRRHFNADPAVVGQAITLDNRPYQIVGVASQQFTGVEPGRFVDVWLPAMTFDPGAVSNPGANLFRIVGRLTDGVSREQVEARLQPVYRDRQLEVIDAQKQSTPAALLKAFAERRLLVRPGGIGVSDFQRSFGRPMWIVWTVASALLLVACANVASLLLSRSAARSPEMSLRTALGAPRARLVRQLLTESLLLSGLAGGLGVLFAGAAAPWLVTLLSSDSDPIRFVLALDGRVLLFCASICTATLLIVGVVPAWQGAAVRPTTVTIGRGEPRRTRLGRLFVSVQVAFVFCLVVTGAGFLFSLHKLSTVDIGFDPRHVTVLTLRSDLGPKQDGLKLTQQLQRQVSMLQNVQGVAVGWWAIFSDNRRTEQILREGTPPFERQETFYRISPGYFDALRTPLLEGRDFDVRDTDGVQPIPTIVNRAFVRRYFGGDAVLGREFRRRADNARHVIVGVAADAYYSDLRSGLQPVVYFPMKPPRVFTLYVRSTLDAGSVMRQVEQAAREAGPGLHVVSATTLETLIGNTLLKEKLLAGVGGVFASLGLVLVAIGLFGLLSYSVVRRTKEIGIRTALGARRQALIALVLKELLGMMAGGLAAGVLGSLALMRLVHSQLFGIATVDPIVMTAAAGVFFLTTVIAVVLPAYRAATMDPLAALRQD
jgi:putative ABC transport system permease protein